MTPEEMVKEFCCPGCVCGYDTDCGKYSPGDGYHGCEGHVVGTIGMPLPGNFALGLPKGFNRTGWCSLKERTHNKLLIRLWLKGESPGWDDFNVAVWAMEKDGFLFVRTYMPRVNNTAVDVVENGTLEMVPGAIDVSRFYEEMD
jgi:hypothetical protein